MKMYNQEEAQIGQLDYFTLFMINKNNVKDNMERLYHAYIKYKPEEYDFLKKCYLSVWSDVEYFPVASQDISFENTWLAERFYGGDRLHEGTDLFGIVKEPGYYPIVSMTDGVVEQKGWLPLGGYRIGIRSTHGAYFYYAHLSEYETGIEIGDKIEAGNILGFMGNSGYGPEGTEKQFPVHLHLGIYIPNYKGEDVSINPYWILKVIYKKIRNYSY